MNSIRKWLYKPKKTDKSLLAQFYFADEDLNKVATELDSFDSRKDPERCHALVSQLRVCQDKVLTIVQRMMVEAIPFARTSRDFRVKFPDDVVQENLAGQLWFGAECLAAGSSIMNRELESASMRPLARALTKNLDSLRHILRDQCLISVNEYSERIREALTIFDKLFAEFELSYVSAMVPVKSVKEYETIQEITVLFSETTIRAKSLGYITTDMIDEYDPALMFTIPRLAIVCGLLIFVDGPLNPDSQSWNMSDMFRPFQTLLYKIRELLFTLSDAELLTLERALCSQEEPDFLASSTAQYNNNTVSSFVPTSTSTIGIQTEGLFVDKVTSEDARPPRNLERLGSNGSAEQRKQRVGSGHVEEIVCQLGPMTEPGDVVLQELQEDTPRPTAYCGDLVHQESNLNKSDSNDSGLHSDVVSSSDSQVTISSSDSNQLLCHSGVHSDVVSSSDSQVTISSSDSNQLLCHSGLASPLPGPSADQAAENCTEQSQDLQVLMHQSSSAVAEHKNLNSDNNPDKICVNCSADVVTESQETVASLPEEEDEDEEQFYTPSSGVSPLHQPPVGGHTGQSHQSSHSGQVHHPSHRRVKEAVPVSLSHKERSRNVDDVLQDDHCPGDQIWNAGDFSQLNSNSNSDNLDDSKEGDYEKQMDCISHFDGVRGSVYSGRDCSSLPVIIGGDASSLAVLSERDSSSLPVLSGGEYSNLPILSGGEYSNLPVLSGGEYSNLTEQLHSVRQKVQTVFRGEVAGELETAAVASEFSEHSITDATLTDVTPLSDTSLALSSDSSCTYFSAQPNCSDSVNVVHCDSGGSGIQQTCCDSINENQKLSVKNSLPSQSEVVSTDFVSSAADSTGLKSDLSQKHCDRCTQTPHSVINNDLSSKIHHHHHYHSCQHSSSPSSSTPASSTHPSSKFFSHNRQEGIAVKTEKTNSSKSDFRTLQLQNVKKERVDKIQRTSVSRVHSARTQKTSQRTRVLKTQHGAQEKVIKLRQYTDNWSDCSSNSEDQTRENQQGGYLQGAMDTSSGSSGCEGTSSASDCESDQDSCGSSETSSYNSESHDDEEIALAVQAAELANRNQARARFRSSSDMIHRLFVCISGVADQLQTNFAGDLRNILRVVFNLNCSEPVVMEDEKSFRRYRRRGAQFFHQQFGVDSRSQNSYLRDPPAWIPDDQSTMCMSCKTPFTFVRRRHHCRNCGKIFCGRCSSNAVSLPHFGHSNPVRVCNHCFVFQVNPFAAQAHL